MTKPPQWWMWVIALLPTLFLGVNRWSAGPGIGAEDWAQYELHARALAEGRPYRDTGYLMSRLNPGHGPSALPPGVPIVLAVVIKVAGERADAIKAAMYAMSVAFFLAAGCYFAMTGEPWLGLGVTLLVGISPTIVQYSNLAQSDLPLCMAVWLTLIVADRPGPWSWGRLAAIAIAGSAAMAFRPLGAALAPALLINSLIHWRERRWRGLLVPLVWLLGAAAGVAVIGLSNIIRDPGWLHELALNLPRQFRSYRIAAGDALSAPTPWFTVNHWYQIVGLVVAAGGLLLWFRAAWRSLAACFAVVYGIVLLVAPFTAPRYLWPLFPLVTLGFLKGLVAIASRTRFAQAALPVALGIAAVVALSTTISIATSPRPGSFVTQPAAQELFAAMRSIAAQRPVRAAFARPRLLALETGIYSMPLLNRPAPEVLAELDRQCVTEVIIGSLGLRPAHDRAVRIAIASRAADFEREWANAEFRVFRYRALHSDRCPPSISASTTAR